MTPASLIARYLDEYEGALASDGNFQQKRRRVLGFLRQVNGYVHNFRNWQWLYDHFEGAQTGDGESYILGTPDTFGGRGPQTRLVRLQDQQVMTYVSPGRLIDLRTLGTNAINDVYSIFAVGGGGKLIQFSYTTTSDLDYTLFYKLAPQIFTDPDDATELLVPNDYEDTVMLAGMAALGQKQKLDDRDGWAGTFNAGLQQMCVNENPMQNDLQQMTGRFWPTFK